MRGQRPLITPNNKGENPFIIPQKDKGKRQKLKEANSTGVFLPGYFVWQLPG